MMRSPKGMIATRACSKACAMLVGWMLVVSAFPAVLSPPASQEVRVIIGFKGRIDLPAAVAEGAKVVRVIPSIRAVAAYLAEERLERLRARPWVAYVELDATVQALGQVVPWGVERVGAPLVHAYDQGEGVAVAVIDTGIDYTHPDLAANYKGGTDFVEDDGNPMDDNGHGTHCAGIIAAAANDEGVLGVAPKAWLYAVKVLDSSGSGYVSDVAAGIDWAVVSGAKVISMSLGSNSDSTTLRNACDAAYAAGVLLVAAAGNDYRKWGSIEFDTVDYPARYSSVIAVGATDQSDVKASWSSTGSTLELAAPGVSIYSTYKGGTYATMSGTSMACPHVAGTAALVWANEPGLTNADVRARLQATADDLGKAGRDNWYGYGLVDADEAAPQPRPKPPVAIAGPDQVLYDNDGSGKETATLDGSASYDPDGTIVSYCWTEGEDVLGMGRVITADFEVRTHTVTLTVTDSDGLTDSDEVVITVNPAQPKMHVGDIAMSKQTSGSRKRAVATVTVVDADGNPVQGATVYGTWSGLISQSVYGITGSDGRVALYTSWTRRSGTCTFTVTDVKKNGWIYDSSQNVETSDSITI